MPARARRYPQPSRFEARTNLPCAEPRRPYLRSRPRPRLASGASATPELPRETDAWWLSRAEGATFRRRRIALSDAHVRALHAVGEAPSVVVEFNGRRFEGASITAAGHGHHELDLGDALAEEMAEVLDEDDALDVEVIRREGRPALAIHPYVAGLR